MTTSATIDIICPDTVGDEKISMQLDADNPTPLAHVPFAVDVDYSGVGNVGISLPIEMIFQGPVAGQLQRRVFKHSAPSSLLLTAQSGGRHLVLLREMFHNRWQGQLFVDVEGETTQISEDR